MTMAAEGKKDVWEKLGVILHSGGGLLTAITVALLASSPRTT